MAQPMTIALQRIIFQAVTPVVLSVNIVNPKDIEYICTRSYGYCHMIYLYHLIMQDPNLITYEVMNNLLRGDLDNLPISYQDVKNIYGI